MWNICWMSIVSELILMVLFDTWWVRKLSWHPNPEKHLCRKGEKSIMSLCNVHWCIYKCANSWAPWTNNSLCEIPIGDGGYCTTLPKDHSFRSHVQHCWSQTEFIVNWLKDEDIVLISSTFMESGFIKPMHTWNIAAFYNSKCLLYL